MKQILLLFSLLLPGWLLAENIPEEQARQVATAFWQSNPQTRGVAPVSWRLILQSEQIATRSTDTTPAYYVYDNAVGLGFVIVAGDDVAMPILGYSFENEFPQTGHLPANLQDWLNRLGEEIHAARRDGIQANAAVRQTWQNVRVGDVAVELETARWNQEEPYNLLCPRTGGQLSYTGCTATAMAIVMRYHQWPVRGMGTLPGYTTATYGIPIQDLVLGHAYDWANMPLDYGNHYNLSQSNAVATLMRDCAISLQADFQPVGSGGTAAAMSHIPEVLVTNFGYSSTARNVKRSAYSTAEWTGMMKGELDANRPILYSGDNTKSGHAFVLDGYTTDSYFSVNWGWGGHYDGYFLLSALEPEGQGAGGSEGGYNNEQWAVVGIQQSDGTAETIEEIRFVYYDNREGQAEGDCEHRIYNGLTVDGEVRQGEPFELHAGFLSNYGTAVFSGEFLFAMTDKNGKIVEELERRRTSGLPTLYGLLMDLPLTITQPIEKGHRIRAYFRSENTPEWTLIHGSEEYGCVWDLVLLDEYTIEESTTFTYDKKNKTIYLFVKNGVNASLADANGKNCDEVCRNEGTSITINTLLLPAGTYTLTLQKGSERKELRFTIGALQ